MLMHSFFNIRLSGMCSQKCPAPECTTAGLITGKRSAVILLHPEQQMFSATNFLFDLAVFERDLL